MRRRACSPVVCQASAKQALLDARPSSSQHRRACRAHCRRPSRPRPGSPIAQRSHAGRPRRKLDARLERAGETQRPPCATKQPTAEARLLLLRRTAAGTRLLSSAQRSPPRLARPVLAKYRQCAARASAAHSGPLPSKRPAVRRCWAAYSRTLSRRSKRSSPIWRTKLLSTSPCTRSTVGGAPSAVVTAATALADSSVKPPSNTDSWASVAFSASLSSSHDQSKPPATSPAGRAGPPFERSTSNRSFMRASNVRGAMTRTRAAASSIARGRQSSTLPAARWHSGRRDRDVALPRSLAASGTARRRLRASSGGTARISSPTMPSTSRVVTMKRA